MLRKIFQRTPILSGEDVTVKREEIRAFFHATLDLTEQLFDTLAGDEAYFKNRFHCAIH